MILKEEYSANRVVQLNAKFLDNSLIETYRFQLDRIAFNLIKNAKWQIAYNDLKKLLNLLYFLPQIFSGSSPGQKLLNIKFNDLPKHLLLHYVLNVLIPHLLDYVSSCTTNRRLQNTIENITSFLKFLNFVYFFYFLKNGQGSSLAEKILNLKTVYVNRPTLGIINNFSLNRELIGHSFGHLFILCLPIFKYLTQKFKRRFLTRNVPITVESEMIFCEECRQIAIFPVLKINKYKKKSVYCYYCATLFNVTMDIQRENFLNYSKKLDINANS